MTSNLAAAVITISDRSSQGIYEDKTGPAVVELLKQNGWQINLALILPDEKSQIESTLVELTDIHKIPLIITAGGTGFAPRDVTPEATRAVIEKEAPGIALAMLQSSLQKTPHAMLSRQSAGIRGKSLIINLPGSPKAAVENLQVVLPALPHAIELLWSDPGSEAGHAFHSP
jgi:molybdenum cofactor synthesis domain-containing protein